MANPTCNIRWGKWNKTVLIMSKLEDNIKSELDKNNIDYQTQIPVPISTWPWKTSRSRTSPKCDIFLPNCNVYIEVKGFMTMEAISKLAFLSQRDFKYYIFQGTEYEWNPSIQSPINYVQNGSNSKILNDNIKHQINELCIICQNNEFMNNISRISIERLRDFISTKINQYASWNGNWY